MDQNYYFAISDNNIFKQTDGYDIIFCNEYCNRKFYKNDFFVPNNILSNYYSYGSYILVICVQNEIKEPIYTNVNSTIKVIGCHIANKDINWKIYHMNDPDVYSTYDLDIPIVMTCVDFNLTYFINQYLENLTKLELLLLCSLICGKKELCYLVINNGAEISNICVKYLFLLNDEDMIEAFYNKKPDILNNENCNTNIFGIKFLMKHDTNFGNKLKNILKTNIINKNNYIFEFLLEVEADTLKYISCIYKYVLRYNHMCMLHYLLKFTKRNNLIVPNLDYNELLLYICSDYQGVCIEDNETPDIIKFIIERDADPNYNNGQVLYNAIYASNFEIVKLLIVNGADPSISSDKLCHPDPKLYYDLMTNHPLFVRTTGVVVNFEILEYILKYNNYTSDEYSNIMIVHFTYANCIKLLIDYGADIHYNNDLLLKKCIITNNEDIVNVALIHGANASAIPMQVIQNIKCTNRRIADLLLG